MNELNLNLPFGEYLKADGVSKSTLDAIVESPHRAQYGRKQTTPAMQFGSMLHALLFEARMDYIVRPEVYGPDAKKWNGNATECKAWMAEHAGQNVISPDLADDMHGAVAAIKNHPHFGQITLGSPEVSMFAFDQGGSGLQLKGRADSLNTTNDEGVAHVVDLKTTTDASTRGFSREILSRRYHIQAAMYRRILRLLGYEQFTWTFIILEKGETPLVNIRRLEPQAIDLGDEQLDRDLELLKKCRLHRWFPHFTDEEEKPGYIDLPQFVYDSEQLDLTQ